LLPGAEPQEGVLHSVGQAFQPDAGNDDVPHVDYGAAKAVTKMNGLTLHPYWERSRNCGVRWTLAE